MYIKGAISWSWNLINPVSNQVPNHQWNLRGQKKWRWLNMNKLFDYIWWVNVYFFAIELTTEWQQFGIFLTFITILGHNQTCVNITVGSDTRRAQVSGKRNCKESWRFIFIMKCMNYLKNISKWTTVATLICLYSGLALWHTRS